MKFIKSPDKIQCKPGLIVWHSNLDHVLLTTTAKQPYYFNPMVCMCFCPINDSIWGSTSYLSYKTTSQESHHFRKTNSPSLEAIDLLMSFFQSPTLHLPLWVVSSASEVRFLYIPLLSESKRDLAKWFQWHSASLLSELMISTVCTPKKWLLDTDIVSWFALLPSLNLSTIALSESSNLIQLEFFIITCTVFH